MKYIDAEPDRIYAGFNGNTHLESYCLEKKGECQTEYLRKDALIEWLLKGIEMSEICHSEYGDACAQAYQAVIDKLNSM